jgi:hypothetical protein
VTQQPHTPPSVAPRWPTLAALVTLVLGLHFVLLAGGLPLNLLAAELVRAPSVADAATAPAQTSPATAASPSTNAVPVRVSHVRWIVPVATPQPVAAPAPPPRKKPVARVAPPPRVEVAAVALVQEEPEPQAADTPPMPEAFEAPAAEAALVEVVPPTAPTELAIAEAAPPTPAEPLPPAAEASVAAADGEPTEPDDMLLAAATPGQPRKPAAAAVKLPPAQPPASTRLLYDVIGSVKGIAYKAQGTLDWTVANGRYDARMDMRVMLLGSRSQVSTGRVGPGGLVPERFADKSRSEKAAHFDAVQQRIRFSSNAPEAPLQPGAQDRLSLFMQIAGLLQARPQAYAAGQTIDMQVAGTGDAPVWRFQVGEESTIKLPAGEFKVRHLVRQPRKEFDSTVEMWLAPRLHHLPVRLRVTQSNGDVADQQLSQMP